MSVYAQDKTKDIMNKLSTELDLAETNLRVVLGTPTKGEKWPEELKNLNTCDAKLASALRLLAFEQRHPGYLQGLHGTATWDQYNEVLKLFERLEGTNDAFALNRQRKSSNRKAQPTGAIK